MQTQSHQGRILAQYRCSILSIVIFLLAASSACNSATFTATPLPPSSQTIVTTGVPDSQPTNTLTPIPIIAAFTPTPTTTATSRPDALLPYFPDPISEIWVYNLNTGQSVPIIQGLENIVFFSLSPDGRRMIYSLEPPMDSSNYVIDLVTRQTQSIPPYLFLTEHTPVGGTGIFWHPFGDAFIGIRKVNEKTTSRELYRITDGAVLAIVDRLFMWDPHFSPDGSKLAVGCRDDHDSICIYTVFMDANKRVTGISSTHTQIAFPSDLRLDPDSILWSPAGDRLAIQAGKSSDRNGNPSHLFTIYLDGSRLTELFALDALQPGVKMIMASPIQHSFRGGYSFGRERVFDWSPDGAQIAFSANNPDDPTLGNSQIFITDANGSGTVMITHDKKLAWRPIWTPDGRILFSSAENNPWVENINELVLSNTEVREKRVLINSGRLYRHFLPQQAHEYLADVLLAKPFVFTCATGWTHLTIGEQARVTDVSGGPNRVRSKPQKGDNVVANISPGTIVTVLEGPVCNEGLIFWKVKGAIIPDGIGWTAEGDGATFWLEPYKP